MIPHKRSRGQMIDPLSSRLVFFVEFLLNPSWSQQLVYLQLDPFWSSYSGFHTMGDTFLLH